MSWLNSASDIETKEDKAIAADLVAYEAAKDAKVLGVTKILVTTSNGNTFDGDEVAQNRMARAVAVGSQGTSTGWKLADNSIVTVTWEELKEALFLAGTAMTDIWMA